MPNYHKIVRRKARKYGVRPELLEAQIQQESGYNPTAVSPAGARGIAQFMPGTAKSYGVNLYDNRARDDIDGAARLMRDMLKRYGGDERKALAAYNAGAGNVDRYGGVPPFAETQNYVKTILAQAGGRAGQRSSAQSPRLRSQGSQSTYELVPGVDRSGERDDLKRQYFANSHDPNALLQLKTGLDSAQDTPSKRVRISRASPVTRDPGKRQVGDALVGEIQAEAQLINDAKVPYQWGGGHAVKQKRGSKVAPLDCSGAVSRALGIDPRVSGEFETWGKPGKGQVTIYANDKHVLMEINGHFFGTSATNPGGGAGWIKRKDVPSSYLKGFTARHL